MHLVHTLCVMHETTDLPSDDQWLISREVMAAARISRRTLDRMVEDGRLEAHKIAGGQRRYRKADVDALVMSPTPSGDKRS
jgi:excisionase family DNA binding protein